MGRKSSRKPYVPTWRITAIYPIGFYRKRVRLVHSVTGEVREVVYGDSVTDAVIRRRAPFVVGKSDLIQEKQDL